MCSYIEILLELGRMDKNNLTEKHKCVYVYIALP